ncbi:MAG: 16S rRNA (guanine(527)-N(7))-methyltransferase RsmG [Paludibacter sp.]|nr:16S rRNA (guanine(527)-N(7))-methyltransferase RsmG [Bacteroidales bacterium]MCM1068986.1 16S rRNA (guanine(527)-N(7))-methyltransferase RsmG [Prevotella sp.]MCM1353649.1 16S rRNA (guanine(527)-N(7))-methyltransferase RsmG [Bacteroides sp.]MCM1442002.1 16S rRNA (guanine(527)-N(7))-methyltransferase RsmG [Muribaculum sp.]MCM1481542.1 16S rRNA (guanine(527)-N(7))-methyltransferase RsmG [Paludibacter sp.]
MELIRKYFTLTDTQEQQFAALGVLYPEWNSRINVISRKDMDNLYEHHILHSLAIAKVLRFKNGTNILDVGTGGGFPGIPLAIMFPECHFTLVDSIGKKIMVATEIAKSLGLQNVECRKARIEDVKETFDFVVSRAVMPLPDLVRLVKKNIAKLQQNALPNGLICLKGGELHAETKPFCKLAEITELSSFFAEEWFKTKKAVYLPL